ncbi:MAG: 4-(cytidine 5'-diphospho)-2-C-methyl-D-erythritol kinase [Sphingobacteriales bacterium]|nr:4-(cytidine 5'-diphospho)-2-C-methyl-D-erythritol kinase [Sphingobacteriales bacterium]
MIVFPNCKINLGLNIIRKRNDGFHELETVFYPLPLYDILEIVYLKKMTGEPGVPFSQSGLKVSGEQGNNLCMRAFWLLKKKFPSMPSIQMHLHKQIPAGGGLGGGSADGAFTLKVLNELSNLQLKEEQLLKFAAQLGSDCPFFIINKPCFSKGRGEKLERIQIDLSSYKFLLVNPGIHIDTGAMFSRIKPAKPEKSLKEIIVNPIETWKTGMKNDFEAIAFPLHPEIKKIKEDLYNAGAIYASMSGSGSSVYGIFSKQQNININFPSKYFVKELAGQMQKTF